MAISTQRSIYDELSDFLVSQPTLEEIANYHLSDIVQQQIDEMIEKNGEDLLSADERLELENILAVASFMDLAKAKAKLKLAGKAFR